MSDTDMPDTDSDSGDVQSTRFHLKPPDGADLTDPEQRRAFARQIVAAINRAADSDSESGDGT